MKINKWDQNRLYFDNNWYLVCEYEPTCCEENYADFNYLTDTDYKQLDFNQDKVTITYSNFGFIFSDGINKIWIPCYSEQNGYYSNEIDVFLFDNKDNLIVKQEAILCKE